MPVAHVNQSAVVTHRKVGDGCSQIAPLHMIPSLVARLLRTAQEGQPAEVKVPPDEEVTSSSAVLEVGSADRGQSGIERVRVCFLCGRPGHGVSRCSQVITSFHRVGQWMSGMGSIGRHGLVELKHGLLRETRDGPGERVSLLDHWGPRYD